MALEKKRIEVDGQVYDLRPWAYKDAKSWGRRLGELFFKRADTIFALGTIGHAVANLDGPTWEAFTALVEKYTDVVMIAEDGSEKTKTLADVAAIHMQGRLTTLITLVSEHAEREFGPFFAELMSVLNGKAATRETAK